MSGSACSLKGPRSTAPLRQLVAVLVMDEGDTPVPGLPIDVLLYAVHSGTHLSDVSLKRAKKDYKILPSILTDQISGCRGTTSPVCIALVDSRVSSQASLVTDPSAR